MKLFVAYFRSKRNMVYNLIDLIKLEINIEKSRWNTLYEYHVLQQCHIRIYPAWIASISQVNPMLSQALRSYSNHSWFTG